MNVKLATCWLLLAFGGSTALAQTHPKKLSPAGDTTKVYVYVEQMPMFNGQNAFTASIAAITQQLVLPPTSPAGRVFVRFEVNMAGSVSHPKIVKGLRADVDSAVVAATRQLPRFTPGKQNGRVVRVSLTLPITIPVAK